MSNADEDTKQEPVELPTQTSATDTSNQNNKVSTDPSGEKYIRTIDENED